MQAATAWVTVELTDPPAGTVGVVATVAALELDVVELLLPHPAASTTAAATASSHDTCIRIIVSPWGGVLERALNRRSAAHPEA